MSQDADSRDLVVTRVLRAPAPARQQQINVVQVRMLKPRP